VLGEGRRKTGDGGGETRVQGPEGKVGFDWLGRAWSVPVRRASCCGVWCLVKKDGGPETGDGGKEKSRVEGPELRDARTLVRRAAVPCA
jgi:hypothetical protein